ncbi:O-antigen polymerase [Vibrio crassostreae]|uniref:O-antigen polymerase n=1 Tax=Vibrio crassostreae TaxID=246167 RepID=UPI001B311732|nr:O-antigen polymerase [Vibrio crassostreae]
MNSKILSLLAIIPMLFFVIFIMEDSIFQVYLSLLLIYLYLYSLNYKLGDPQVLILIGIIFFNARPFLDIIFSTSTFGDTHGFFKSGSFDVDILEGAKFYIKLSILAFMLGMFRVKKNDDINNGIDVFEYKTNSYYREYLFLLLFPTLLSCFILIFLCVLNGGYAYFNSGNVTVSILRRFIPLLSVCLTLNLLFYKKKFITYITILVCLSITVFIGARIIGIMPIICIIVYCSFKYKNIYNKYLPILGALIILFSVLINFLRSGHSLDANINYLFFIKFFLNEISFTTNLIPMAFEYTSSNGFSYGINYMGAISSIIPKLAFWMKVSEDSYSFSSALGMFYDPSAIMQGLGLNGSMLGEAYYSFGFFGVLLIFIMSFSLRLLFSKTTSNRIWSYFVIAASPYLLTMFIFESTIIFRSVTYYSIFPIVIYFIFIKKFTRVKKW